MFFMVTKGQEMVREKLYQRSGEKSRNFILSEKLYVFERCHRKVKSQMKETHSACLGLFYMKDDNVTREYCSVYLIDPSKHTVSLVMQARVGLGMKLFTYLFLFSQFFNIQKVFGAIHPT